MPSDPTSPSPPADQASPAPGAPSTDELRRIDAILDQAFDLEPDEITAFLDRECPPELRPRVERMLESFGPSTLLRTGGGMASEKILEDVAEGLGATEGELEDGDRVGPYRIVGRLGQGGMGYVYLAERADGQFEQRVALKVADAGGRSRTLARRFALERQILASLDHPNIARLLDGGVDDDRPWFAMELVEGKTLVRYCDENQLSVSERLQLFVTVGRAVAAAHRQLVVHRDLKPSNILVTADGVVKLLDFGIAKLLDEGRYADTGTDLTQTHMVVMTPDYAAPEQFLGEPVTTATDVYQLGLLLYELLTGHRAFDLRGVPRAKAQLLVCGEDPQRPSTVVAGKARSIAGDTTTVELERLSTLVRRSSTPQRLRRILEGDLDTVVMKALRKEPERRYLSVADLVADIDRYLTGHPISARPDSVTYRVKKFARRNAGAVISATAATVLLVALTVFYTVSLRHERDVARQEAARANLVSEFLADVFGGADPYQNRGAEPTASELLAEGAQRLENLEGEPEVRADLTHLVGRIYGRLGLYEDARPLLGRALDERRTLFGQSDPRVAETLTELSTIDELKGELEPARAEAQEALDILRASGADAGRRAAAWIRLASVLAAQQELDEAWEAGQTALGLAESVQAESVQAESIQAESVQNAGSGRPEMLLLRVLSELGHIALAQGEQTTSLELFRRAQAMVEDWAAERQKHPEVARVYRNLGNLYGRQGETDQARAVMERALAIYDQVLAEDHPELGGLLINLGDNYLVAEDPEPAVPLLERAIAICEKHLGHDHFNTAVALLNLSNARSMLGDHDEGLRLHREATDILGGLVGAKHPMAVHAFGFRGELLRRAGRIDESLAIHGEAIDLALEVFGAEHPELAQFYEERARVYEEVGRYQDAADDIRRQLAVREPHLEAGSEAPERLRRRIAELEAKAET